MSSSFELLCVSHTPAIGAAGELPTADDAARRIAAGLPEHPHCDLIIARRSGGLVEFGCPPTAGRSGRCYHSSVRWVDVEWLRLLAAGYQVPDVPVVADAVAQVPRCWTPARVASIVSLL